MVKPGSIITEDIAVFNLSVV